jgi:hypothetical protein
MNALVPPFGADPIGWAIAATGAIVTIGVIALAVYLFVVPGEGEADHPKRLILKDNR